VLRLAVLGNVYAMSRAADDPFVTRFELPVAGGQLNVARAGPPRRRAEGVVVALHGITASHMAWRAAARALVAENGICVLAPDLRGRGRSAGLPGPYGFAAHLADLLALLDRIAAPQIVLAGHSMGAYVAARFAAEYPERVSSLVLVDGGPPIPVPADKDPDEVLTATLGPAAKRLDQTFPTRADYVAMWREHPAFAAAWNPDIEAFVNYDVESARDVEHPNAVRSVVSPDAVQTNGRELLLDETTRTALDRVLAPVRLLRAPRGLLDDDRPLIPDDVLAEFAAAHPNAHVEIVPDTNHYTILLGPGPGPSRVAAAVRAAVNDAAGPSSVQARR
jgi:pimeloyl-ACP methyl ester carboxylesterase